MKRKARKRPLRPGYPTRQEVLADPDLLARNLPASFLKNDALARAAALLIALHASGCGDGGARDAGTVAPAGDSTRPPAVGEASGPERPPAVSLARVAPLFLHGKGRGATGCGVMAPPVFLSEEEALQIIREELGRHGIRLSDHGATMDRVRLPGRKILVTRKRDGSEHRQVIEDPEAFTSVLVDAADRKHRVAVEFVSKKDYRAAGGVSGGSFEMVDEKTGERHFLGSSVRDYDFTDAGRFLRSHIERQARASWHYGVFYDPVVWADLENAFETIDRKLEGDARRQAYRQVTDRVEKDARNEARELLRAQVRDFAAWLRQEGVI